MDFLKKIGERAENLLEAVDQNAAAQARDLRAGGPSLRAARANLDKALADTAREAEPVASATPSAGTTSAPATSSSEPTSVVSESKSANVSAASSSKKLLKDLEAAREVLRRFQEAAGERELGLETSLRKEREDRERREQELLSRIQTLEIFESLVKTKEEEVQRLTQELARAEAAEEPEDFSVAEFQRQAEEARVAADEARSALAANARVFETRMAELERANAELASEVRRLGSATPAETPVSPKRPLASAMEISEYEEKLAASEDRRVLAEKRVQQEQQRCERAEEETRRLGATIDELRGTLSREATKHHEEMFAQSKQLQEVKQELESLRRVSEGNDVKSMEKRLTSLSSHVESKQRVIDELRHEKTQLETQLAAYRVASQLPSLTTSNAETNARSAAAMDSKEIFTNAYKSSHFAGGQARRARRGWAMDSDEDSDEDKGSKPMSRLSVFSRSPPQILRLVDRLDSWSMKATRAVRRVPWVRLAAVVYVVLAHLLGALLLATRGGGREAEEVVFVPPALIPDDVSS